VVVRRVVRTMKTKLAIAGSVACVLGAGSVAALVNTQILSSPDTDTALAAPSVSTPATAASSTVADGTTTTSTLATGLLTTFQVGEAGAVTVDVVDGRLVVPKAEPASGWALAAIDDASDDGEIDVSFASESTVVDFAVALVGDELVPRVSSTAVTSTSASSTTVAPDVANTVADTVPAGTTVANGTGAPTTSIDDDGGEDNSGHGGDDTSGHGGGDNSGHGGGDNSGHGGGDDDDHHDDHGGDDD
jgi:uncharacterized membrane protein YgcG